MFSLNDLLYDKINKNLEDDIISRVSYTEKEIEELRNFFLDLIKDNLYSSLIGCKILFVLCVNSAKDWGQENDNNFWMKIKTNLFGDAKFKQTDFYSCFEVLSDCKLVNFFKSRSGKTMYRETVLFHAMAPRSSVKSFISMLFKFFISDTSSDEVDEDYITDINTCQNISEALADYFSFEDTSSDDKEIEFAGDKYNIKAGIKYGFRQCKDVMTQVIKEIAECIIARNKNINLNSTIYSLVDDTLTDYWNFEGKKLKVVKKRTTSDVSRLSLQYELDINNKTVNLVIPEVIQIRKSENPIFKANIKLYINNDFQKCIELHVSKAFSTKQFIRGLDIDLSQYKKLFEDGFNIRVQYVIDGVIVYDSKENLYKSFLLFSDKGTPLSALQYSIGEYTVVVPKNYKIKDIEKTISVCNLWDSDLDICYIKTDEKDYLNYGDRYVYFGSNSRIDSSRILNEPKHNAILKIEDEEYQIFKNNVDLQYISNKKHGNHIVCVINGKDYILTEDMPDYEVNYTGEKYIIHFNGDENTLYKVRLYDASRKLISSYNFAIFNHIHINFNKKIYFDCGGNCRLEINSEQEQIVSFDKTKDNVEFPIKIYDFEDVVNGTIHVKIPVFKYEIRTEDNRYEGIKFNTPLEKNQIYKDYFDSSTLIVLPDEYKYVSKIKYLYGSTELACNIVDNKYYGLPIISEPSIDEVKAILEISSKEYELFTIYYFPTIDKKVLKLEFGENEVKHNLKDSFIGDLSNVDSFVLSIENEEYEDIGFEYEIEDIEDSFNLEEDEIPPGRYNLYIDMNTLFPEETKPLYESSKPIKIGNLDTIEYAKSQIVFKKTKDDNGHNVKFKNYVIKNIKYIEENDYAEYEGYLYGNGFSKQPVRFFKKDPHFIIVYFYNDETYFDLYYDKAKNKIVKEENSDTSEIRSINCEKEAL